MMTIISTVLLLVCGGFFTVKAILYINNIIITSKKQKKINENTVHVDIDDRYFSKLDFDFDNIQPLQNIYM